MKRKTYGKTSLSISHQASHRCKYYLCWIPNFQNLTCDSSNPDKWITVLVGSGATRFWVQKGLFASKSPYFRLMFENDREGNKDVVELPHVTVQGFCMEFGPLESGIDWNTALLLWRLILVAIHIVMLEQRLAVLFLIIVTLPVSSCGSPLSCLASSLWCGDGRRRLVIERDPQPSCRLLHVSRLPLL